jgi:hypothetical protein
MASTLARTGRSMKNFEITGAPPSLPWPARGGGWSGGASRRRGVRRLHLRIDLLARYSPQHAGHHHAVLRVQTTLDHAPLIRPRADLDLALRDDIVLVDDEDIAPSLIAADRRIGNEQGILRFAERNAHAHEIARQQYPARVLQHGADRQRPGRRIDRGRGVVERAPVRISGFRLQSDLHRNLPQIVGRQSAARHVGPDVQNVLFAHVEIYIDRIMLNDGGEQRRRRAAADELPDRHLPRRYDAVKRGGHVRIFEVQGGQPRVDLRLRETGLT